MLFYSKLHEKINCVDPHAKYTVSPCQSVNNSGWVDVAANVSITLYISDFVVDILYIFDVTSVQLAGG